LKSSKNAASKPTTPRSNSKATSTSKNTGNIAVSPQLSAQSQKLTADSSKLIAQS
jgi:hypothetical protein